MTIGERIKQERQNKGVSQAALGEMLQITQQAVAKWERDLSEPDSQMLIKLATFFNVSVDYLLGRDSITPEEKAAGASETKMIRVTPKEDELIYLFREVGKRHGEKGQQAVLDLTENLLKM